MTITDTPQRATTSERLASAPWPELAAPVALVALVLVFGALDSTFLTTGNIDAILQARAILIVLAVGQTLVVATAGIALSVATTMTLAAVVLGRVYASGAGIFCTILSRI